MKVHGNTGKKHSDEAKAKMRLAKLGTKATAETKQKMSATRTGKKRLPMSAEWKAKVSAGRKGKGHGPITAEHKEKLRIANLGNHHGLGKPRSTETRLRMSAARSGEKAWNWKGGIEPENKRIRQSIEYRLWREAVYLRDRWTCQKCHVRGNRLHPHHVRNFADTPEARFDVENGITLCEGCHRGFHKQYGQTGNNAQQLGEYLCQL